MRPSERHLALLMRTVEVKFGGARASSTPVRGNARVERKPPASSRSSKPRAARDFTSNKGQALTPRQRTGTHAPTKDRHSRPDKGQALNKGQALKGQALKGQALKGQAYKGQAYKGQACIGKRPAMRLAKHNCGAVRNRLDAVICVGQRLIPSRISQYERLPSFPRRQFR